MSFMKKLASFKNQKIVVPKKELETPKSEQSLYCASVTWRAIRSVSCRELWFHFLNEGCLGLIDVELLGGGKANISFQHLSGLSYAIKYVNNSSLSLELGGITLQVTRKYPVESIAASEHNDDTNPPDFIIGGLGGSGTRLIAEVIQCLGADIGYDLNESSDNLLFTLLFKRLQVLNESPDNFLKLVSIMSKGLNRENIDNALSTQEVALCQALASENRKGHKSSWLQERVLRLLKVTNSSSTSSKRKFEDMGASEDRRCLHGWKEPNSHVLLDRFVDIFPNTKYIHVIRNGVDMVKSNNQNQLSLWGDQFLGKRVEPSITNDLTEPLGRDSQDLFPRCALKYWCSVHKRVYKITSRMKPSQFLCLNYDDFCSNPVEGIKTLRDFLDLQPTEENVLKARSLVRPPSKSTWSSLSSRVQSSASVSEFRHDLKVFDIEDVAYVKSLGFEVDGKCMSTIP